MTCQLCAILMGPFYMDTENIGQGHRMCYTDEDMAEGALMCSAAFDLLSPECWEGASVTSVFDIPLENPLRLLRN